MKKYTLMMSLIFLFAVALFAADWTRADEADSLDKSHEGNYRFDEPSDTTERFLDLAVIDIESSVAREYLGTDTIRVRNPNSTYMPEGMLPILTLARPTEQDCKDRLDKILHIHGREATGSPENRGGVITEELRDASCWVHPASGSYKYTVTGGDTTKPTELGHFREAVLLGLEHISKHDLIELAQDEELDILTVSSVYNVVTDIEAPERPLEKFVSDYYVSFGRRYLGVPVIGSHLTLRINGAGEVVMLNSNWRHIATVGREEARITPVPMNELIFRSPVFQEVFGSREVSPKDITIASFSAGYVEAPFNHTQDRMRPGLHVSFWVGDLRDERLSQLTIPLEDSVSVETLLGK